MMKHSGSHVKIENKNLKIAPLSISIIREVIRMAERLKDMFFTQASINKFADTIKSFYPTFDKSRFLELVFDKSFETKELLDKMRHTTRCLHDTLPESYKDALTVLIKAAPHVKGFEAMAFPDYVATYGLDEWDLSLPALGHFTQYYSSELAIRPFLAKNPEKGMTCMIAWAGDKNPKLRRLASEGCRPRLPWAMALPKFKKDPRPILPILEKLKNDDSEDVRRSVANNLNDISKDNPDLALEICERWYGESKETDKIVKHACRTLLKAGNPRALAIFGYGDPSLVAVKNMRLDKKALNIGDSLTFSFDVTVTKKSRVRLEYAVDYVKAKDKLSKKVFKITENDYAAGSYSITRKQSFQEQTTRKHYPGTHRISIIVNGEEKAKASFDLKK
jgi:3-methyladenine DNA glycosylase AlkC